MKTPEPCTILHCLSFLYTELLITDGEATAEEKAWVVHAIQDWDKDMDESGVLKITEESWEWLQSAYEYEDGLNACLEGIMGIIKDSHVDPRAVVADMIKIAAADDRLAPNEERLIHAVANQLEVDVSEVVESLKQDS